MINIMKHGDVALVQVPSSWDVRDVRQEQGRVDRYLKKAEVPVKVVIVGGGSDAAVDSSSVADFVNTELAAVAE